ncbi:MAG: NUDIX hydrolase [Beduini sp.]|uniref:NUDIX hydrolase n=1 Tax=Beduini sp. TaxID=1922300 RepID=UPI0039A1AB4A
MEQIDIYNQYENRTGKICDRGIKMLDGEYQLIVTIWTVNYNKKLLITQRDPNKDFYGSYWECTGGAVIAGENQLEAAKRELQEETGIEADISQFQLFDKRFIGNNIYYSYILHYNFCLNDILLQKGETVSAAQVDLNELEDMYNYNQFIPVLWSLFNQETKEYIFK